MGLDSVVDNALACHLCNSGSNLFKACGRVVVARSRSVVSLSSPVSSTPFDHIAPAFSPSRTCMFNRSKIIKVNNNEHTDRWLL